MKNIKIKRLALENFKCHKSLVLRFEGGNAAIYGDNATGKTSVYDALTWLLFAKDSKGNGEKNIEIKPLNENGEVCDHLAETMVEAVLLVNGEEITFRRIQKEVWSTKRGSAEASYDGNTSEFYIDGVPVKRFAFSDKVNELVDEDTFRMLTSVSHFADGISWQERREVLFRVANVMDDAQIMATDEKFKPLLENMGKHSVDDFKKKLLSDKKGFVGAKNEIPARISECQKTIEDVQSLDFDKARSELEMLNAAREGVEKQIIALEHDTLSEEKRMQIREVRLELNTLSAENAAFRSSQTSGAPDISGIKNEISRLQAQLNAKRNLISSVNSAIANIDREIAASRERWISVNAEAFGGGMCPTCGQALPSSQLKAATDSFEAQKATRLREIEQTANARKESKAQQEARLAELSEEITAIDLEIKDTQERLKTAEASVIKPVDMEGYAEQKEAFESKIRTLEIELADMAQNTATVKCELQKQLTAIKTEIENQQQIVSKNSLLDYSLRRVEELQEYARNTAACLDAIEQMIYLIDEYARYKARFVEDSINGMFRIARFRLFREQANGGIEDRCDVVYDGVPYINVNNGAKINLGIDIINTLSCAYGVSVPLFIDNAESVTNLEYSENQIIRLVVSKKDKELRIDYEN